MPIQPVPATITSAPPPSVAHWLDPFVIAAAVVAAYLLLHDTSLTNVQLSLVLTGVVFLVMTPIEYIRSPARQMLRPSIPLKTIFSHTLIKFIGIMLGVAIMLIGWAVIPEYDRKEYEPMFQAMPYVLSIAPVIIFAFVFLTEWRLGPVEDQAWQFGQLALRRFDKIDWAGLRTGLFGLMVRGFFLPLNFCAAVVLLDGFRTTDIHTLHRWPSIVSYLDKTIFAVLIFSIIPGYVFGSRLLGTSLKKVDQTWFGWIVTFFCYPPINRGTGTGWFLYHIKGQPIPWITWFGSNGTASIAAGSFLILFYLIHYWGEAICCMRSAHLSSRGIITNGPFRLCKHPVYVAKCLAWSITYLPFINSTSLHTNVIMTVGFLGFCSVYVLRGWIEERLLSTDPTYVAYAMWMEEHSMFRFLGKKIPFFSFKWRLERWNRGFNLSL